MQPTRSHPGLLNTLLLALLSLPAAVSAQTAATLYQHCNFGGYQVNLPEGNFDLRTLQQRGARNDDISGLRVAPGYQAILYEHAGFQGRSWTFNSSDDCLVDNGLNDQASSIRVVRVATPSPSLPSQPIPTPHHQPQPHLPPIPHRPGREHLPDHHKRGDNNLAVTLGSCRATLRAAEPWQRQADGSFSTASRDIQLQPQGINQSIPLRIPANSRIRSDLSNLRLDASLLPLPREGLFAELQPQPGAISGPISAGIALGSQIRANAADHPLDPNKSYLYFQLNSSLSIDLDKKQHQQRRQREPQRRHQQRSVGINNLVFALDPCDPSLSIGGVEANIDGIIVALDAISLSAHGSLSHASQQRIWTGETHRSGEPQLQHYSQRGHYFQQGAVGLGFGKFLGIRGTVASMYDLDPRGNGLLGITQAAEFLQGRAKPSPLDYKLMLEGQLNLDLAGLVEMPLQSALITLDASDPYHTQLKLSGKRGPALSLAELFPGTPPPGAELIRVGGNIQLYVNADFNSLSGRPNGVYRGKLRGAFTVGPAKVRGDVDLTFRENRPPEVCVKLPGVDRACGHQIDQFVARTAKQVGQAVDQTGQALSSFFNQIGTTLGNSFNDSLKTLGNIAQDAAHNTHGAKQCKQESRQLASAAAQNLRNQALREGVDKLYRTIQPKLQQLNPQQRNAYAQQQLDRLKQMVEQTRQSVLREGSQKVYKWSVNPEFGKKYSHVYTKTFDQTLGNLQQDMQSRMQRLLNR